MKAVSRMAAIAGRRMTGALAVAAILLFAIGCGNSGSVVSPPLNGSYGKGSLKGQYVLTLTGIGINQSNTGSDYFSEAVVLTADGNGVLTISVDDFNQSGTSFGISSNLAGTYGISSDGTGFLSFNSSSYQITMIDDSHFYVIQQNVFATASGHGELQTSANAVPSGTYVFKAHRIAFNNTGQVASTARVGALVVSGGVISAQQDQLFLGSMLPGTGATPITGSFGTDSSGRPAFQLSDGTAFHSYSVNGNKFYFLSLNGDLEIGQAELQTGTTLAANASYVFGSSGDTLNNTIAIHSAGVFTSNGTTQVTGGATDFVQDGNVSSVTLQSGTNYSVDASGRGVLNLLYSNGLPNQKVFWVVNSNKAYFLVNGTAAVEDGVMQMQTGSSFSNSSLGSQSAIVMDGFDTTFKDRVGAMLPDGNGNMRWHQQANAFSATQGAGVSSFLSTNGTYQVGSNGRATVAIGGVSDNVVFYLISNNNGFMVQEDTGFGIGGAFAQQSGQ